MCRIGHGNARRPERLLGQPQQHDRVLAAAEQQHRPLELGGDLAHHVDGLVLERVQLRASAIAEALDAHSRDRAPDWRSQRRGAVAGDAGRGASIVGAGSRAKSS